MGTYINIGIISHSPCTHTCTHTPRHMGTQYTLRHTHRWKQMERLTHTSSDSLSASFSCSLLHTFFLTHPPTHTHTHTHTRTHAHTRRHTKRAWVAYLTLQCLITLITPAEIFDKRSFITARAVLPLSSHNMAAADTNCLEESHSHYHI